MRQIRILMHDNPGISSKFQAYLSAGGYGPQMPPDIR